jgi:hypothetical protein
MRSLSIRLLKNQFWEGRAPNILYASLLDYTFGSASLVASARFSAACYGANREVHNRLKPFSTPFLDGVSGRDQVGLGRPLLIHPKADRRPKRLQLRQPFQGHN